MFLCFIHLRKKKFDVYVLGSMRGICSTTQTQNKINKQLKTKTTEFDRKTTKKKISEEFFNVFEYIKHVLEEFVSNRLKMPFNVFIPSTTYSVIT